MNRFEQIKSLVKSAFGWPYVLATVTFLVGFSWLVLSRWF